MHKIKNVLQIFYLYKDFDILEKAINGISFLCKCSKFCNSKLFKIQMV